MDLKKYLGSGCQKGSAVTFSHTIWPFFSAKGTANITKLTKKKLELNGSVQYKTGIFGPWKEEDFSLQMQVNDSSAAFEATFGDKVIRDDDAYSYIKNESFCMDADIDEDPEDDVHIKLWAHGENTKVKVGYENAPRITIEVKAT